MTAYDAAHGCIYCNDSIIYRACTGACTVAKSPAWLVPQVILYLYIYIYIPAQAAAYSAAFQLCSTAQYYTKRHACREKETICWL